MTINLGDNPAGAAPDEKLPPSKAETLRDQTLAAKGLGGLDPEATLYVFAAALLAESDDGYTRDQAVGILQRARKVSLQTLATAVSRVTAQMAEAMTSFWSEFVKETWQGPDAPPKYVDPSIVAKRREQEEKEQEQIRQSALEYVNNAQVVVGALAIDEKEFPKTEGPAKKSVPRIDVAKVLHNLIYRPAEVSPGEPHSAAPGWLTPPLIDKSDEDIAIFDNDIMPIVAHQKLSGEQAWKKLEGRGYDRQRIVRTIYDVRKTAQNQIAQCDQILSFIRNDYQTHFEPVVKAAVLLGHAISVVNEFYAPLPPAGESPNPPQGWPARRRGG